jgi:hypothetical protein
MVNGKTRYDADEALAEMVAEIYAEAGAPTEADRTWARQALGLDRLAVLPPARRPGRPVS